MQKNSLKGNCQELLPSDTVIGITHTRNEDEAEELRQELNRQFQPKEVLVAYMGATMVPMPGKIG